MRRLIPIIALMFAAPLYAQAAAAPATKFEIVATVKPSKLLSNDSSTSMSDGRFSATNVSTKRLITRATNIRGSLINGLPPWALNARWDVVCKVLAEKEVLENMTKEQRQSMVMSLLEDQFKLKMHIEKKELPVYDLVLVKMGPNLKPNAKNDPANPNRKLDSSMNQDNTDIKATDVNMQALVDQLSQDVPRTVIDKTGLKGGYDFTLSWTPDENEGADNGSTETTPGIFTALQEQLGLKLVPSKGMVDTIVVDSIEHPVED